MNNENTLLTEYPANLWQLFHDDHIINKYRLKLAALVIERTISPKRERAEIQEEIDVVQRQIKGRQIQLYKTSKTIPHEL